MPPAIIAAVAALATAGVTVGQTIYNDTNQPGQPAQPTPAQITNQAVQAEQANRATATKEAGQVLPDLQYATGGGLSPDAYQTLSSQFSGNAQYGNSDAMQKLVAQFLGIDQGASFGANNPFGSGGANPTSPGLAAP